MSLFFFITKRLSKGRVFREGDTWQNLTRALRTTGSAAAADASGHAGDPGTIGRAGTRHDPIGSHFI